MQIYCWKQIWKFSYTNNENLLFHRVWTTLMNKDNGLKLCQKFKKEKIVCILQVKQKIKCQN